MLLTTLLLAASALAASPANAPSGGAPPKLPSTVAALSQPSQDSPAAAPGERSTRNLHDQSNSATFAEDDVCYKIRAYLFQRDDDHAPKLVGTTTCGPRRPHTKSVDWPKAKLVPAN